MSLILADGATVDLEGSSSLLLYLFISIPTSDDRDGEERDGRRFHLPHRAGPSLKLVFAY